MGHEHSHGHHHHTSNKKALLGAFLIISLFMIVEVIGGIWTNSLALLSDAGHMLSDAAALGLSLYAIILGERKASPKKTYGYRRFEIIASAINGLTLLGISGLILYEAFKRFTNPPEVQGGGMLTIAVIGLLVNVVAAWLLMRGDREHNLNVRSAFLHVLGDLLGSVGAITAAVLIYFFGWTYADPIASVIVAILILVSGVRVTGDSFHILMEGSPQSVLPMDIKGQLLKIPEVVDVHDLHIWSITSELPVLTCHITIKDGANHDQVLQEAQVLLKNSFGINHSTVQVETEAAGCPSSEYTCDNW
ncbi:MAG: cation diffusion facilitator family transporter [Bacillus sp. (in: firmicutes)]